MTPERHTPQGRVLAYIKDPIYGPTGQARKFVELLGFRNVSTSTSRNSPGSATITFPNYKSALIRYVSADTISWVETDTTGAPTTNSMAADFMSRLGAAEGAGATYSSLWNDVVLSRGDQAMVDPAVTADFKNYSRSRGDVAEGQDRNAQQDVTDQKIIHAMPFLDVFDPIFVDYMGQDGFWYAGFTGLISKVSEVYNRTGDQSITLSCKDLSCLFDNVSIVSGWNRFPAAEQASALRNYAYSTEANLSSSHFAPFGTIFDSFTSVQAIIEKLVGTAQDMWRLEDHGKQLFGPNIGVGAFKFKQAASEYTGISGRRGSVQRYPGEDPTIQKPVDFLTFDDSALEAKHYLYTGQKNGTATLEGTKKILIDPLIMQFDQKFIHKLLNNTLSLYKDSLKSADQILNDLVAKMYAYKYFDANGNLIIELARPNAFPNLEDYGGRSTATMVQHAVPPAAGADSLKDVRTLNVAPKNTVWLTENAGPDTPLPLATDGTPIDPTSDEYTQLINWSTLKFHGRNYVMTPDDYQSFTADIDEGALITVATTDSKFPYFEVGDVIANSQISMHAVAVAEYDKLAKMGIRRFQAQALYNVAWPSKEAGARVLSYQAAAVLERMNAQAENGSVNLNQRPDIQLGRTFINPLRMKSYIIEGITNSWSPGGPHTTSLKLSYGHPVHKTLEVPWFSIFAEPQIFFGSDGANILSVFSKIAPVDSNGVAIPVSGEEGYISSDTIAPGTADSSGGEASA